MSNAKRSWQDVLKIHPAANLLPPMSPEEFKALTDDVRKNGLKTPVVLFWKDEKGYEVELLDGRHRLDAIEAAGRTIVGEDCPAVIDMRNVNKLGAGLIRWDVVPQHGEHDGFDPYSYVLSLNLHRRHLDGKQKDELIGTVIKANQKNQIVRSRRRPSPATPPLQPNGQSSKLVGTWKRLPRRSTAKVGRRLFISRSRTTSRS